MVDLLEAVAAEGRWIGTEAPVDRGARRRRFAEGLQRDDQVTYVAVADGALVGQLGVELERSGVAGLGVHVAAEWRGRGVGSSLMESGIAWAREAGAHKVTLKVWPHNLTARALYRKFGFEEEGVLRRQYRRRSGELWDVVVMGLVLDEDSPGCSLSTELPS
jgi:RimJ/RimL family protein N-acetyltransferase